MIKLLTTKVAKQMIENRQYQKINHLLGEKRFDREAVLSIIENEENLGLDYEIITSTYSFNELFNSWEEYVNSNMALNFSNNPDFANSISLGWIADFPKSSEELLRIAKNCKNNAVVFRNIIYRRRGVYINPELRKNYCNCYEGIITLIMENRKEFTRAEAIEYFIDWGFYLDSWNINAISYEVEEAVLRNLLVRRIAHRENTLTKEHLIDVVDTIEFFDKRNSIIQIANYVYALVNIFNYSHRIRESDTLDFAKIIYDNYVKKYVKDNLIEICACITPTHGTNRKGYTAVYAFEENEDILNKAFEFACKLSSIETACAELSILAEDGIEVKITNKMSEISIVGGRGFSSLLLNKPIHTAEQLISLARRVSPLSSSITGPLSYYCLKNIKLENFSNDELDALNSFIDWDHICIFFDKSIPPYEFLMRVEKRITRLARVPSTIVDTYTSEQIYNFIEKFESKVDIYTMRVIKSELIQSDNLDLDEERIAKIITTLERVPFRGGKVNNNVDLQSILTYL